MHEHFYVEIFQCNPKYCNPLLCHHNCDIVNCYYSINCIQNRTVTYLKTRDNEQNPRIISNFVTGQNHLMRLEDNFRDFDQPNKKLR